MVNTMNFDLVDFTRTCSVSLHVEGYGEVSGLTFQNKKSLSLLEELFKTSHDWMVYHRHDEGIYIKGFIDPGDLRFHKFMSEKTEAFKKEQDCEGCDFFDVWEDNDIDGVHILFPFKKHHLS